MNTFTLTAGDASISVMLPPTADAPPGEDDAELRKRQDTNFKFEVVSPDGAPLSAEALVKKTRSDTNFKFELLEAPAGPGSETDTASGLTTSDLHESVTQDETSVVAGKKRQDTSFRFEITTRHDPADGATGSTEALGGRTRKDTSFKFEVAASDPGSVLTEAFVASKRESANFDFERTATPTDGGRAITEMQESLGISGLLSETLDEVKKPRHDTSFSVAVVTPGGVFASIVLRSSESAGTDE